LNRTLLSSYPKLVSYESPSKSQVGGICEVLFVVSAVALAVLLREVPSVAVFKQEGVAGGDFLVCGELGVIFFEFAVGAPVAASCGGSVADGLGCSSGSEGTTGAGATAGNGFLSGGVGGVGGVSTGGGSDGNNSMPFPLVGKLKLPFSLLNLSGSLLVRLVLLEKDPVGTAFLKASVAQVESHVICPEAAFL